MASGIKRLTDSGGPDGVSKEVTTHHSKVTKSLSRNSSTSGSFRKVLPPLPDMDQQLSMATRMIDCRTSTKKGNHAYAPYYLEYMLLGEYNLLQKRNLSGIYVIPSAKSPLIWFGVIFIREGLYQGGIFRFNINIPENYPDGDIPAVIFETPVFHPLVDPKTGELDVERGFSNKWKRNFHHLWHILLYLRRIFYKIQSREPKNPDAAVLFESDPGTFEKRVRSCVFASKEIVLSQPQTDDEHAIRFSPYDPAIHDPIQKEIKKEKEEYRLDAGEPNSKGLSWVQPGSLSIFSKPQT